MSHCSCLLKACRREQNDVIFVSSQLSYLLEALNCPPLEVLVETGFFFLLSLKIVTCCPQQQTQHLNFERGVQVLAAEHMTKPLFIWTLPSSGGCSLLTDFTLPFAR